MTKRTEKVESLIKQMVALAIPELLEKAAVGVTVTKVDVSPDLRQGIVWLGILGDDAVAVMQQVDEQRPQLQARVAAGLTTKFVPRLSFRHDTGGTYADHINRLLRESS